MVKQLQIALLIILLDAATSCKSARYLSTSQDAIHSVRSSTCKSVDFEWFLYPTLRDSCCPSPDSLPDWVRTFSLPSLFTKMPQDVRPFIYARSHISVKDSAVIDSTNWNNTYTCSSPTPAREGRPFLKSFNSILLLVLGIFSVIFALCIKNYSWFIKFLSSK